MSRPWKNDVGNYRYQPDAFDGETLWCTTAGNVWSLTGDNYGGLGPKLYRSEARADRVGRRRDTLLRTHVYRELGAAALTPRGTK